jgi:hypothetical protein
MDNFCMISFSVFVNHIIRNIHNVYRTFLALGGYSGELIHCDEYEAVSDIVIQGFMICKQL